MPGSRSRLGSAVGALALVAGACSWPTVGHGADRSAAAPNTAITAANIGTLHEAWRSAAGVAESAPVVGAGKVYVTTSQTDATKTATLSAFDALGATGCSGVAPAACASTWSYTYPPIKPPIVPSTPSGPYLSPPTVDGNTVDVGVVQYGIFENYTWTDARSVTDGASIRQIGSQFGGRVSSAVVGDTLVTSGTDMTQANHPSPMMFDYLAAFDTATGARRFAMIHDASNGAIVPTTYGTPAVAGGVVYALTHGSLDAFDLAGVESCGTGSGTYPLSGTVCVPMWSAGVPSTAWDAMPAVANGNVYVPTVDGRVLVFDAHGCGHTSCSALWTARAGTTHVTPVAVTGTTLFAGSDDGHLYAFPASGCGAPTCDPTWSGTVAGGARSPSVAGSFVYVAAADGIHAFAVDGCGAATCSDVWHASVGAPVTAPVAVAGGWLYATDADGRVHAFTTG